MIDLKQLINDNMAVLDAESEHQEVLAEQTLERQRKALKELRDDIQPVVKEAGYNIALCKTAKHHAKKHRSYDDGNRYSEEIVCLLKIEFEYSECLKHTGETESYYAPTTRYAGQHCGGNDPAYIKISWNDTKGVYYMVPNVAYDYNKERDDVDKQIYLELCGTKDMIVKRLALVLANVIRLDRNFNATAKDCKNA
tara:strand:- start:213 stop:800 length:588 start_codon:yes stop_codon:yes gene_type:complete